jgi:uncharacterized protein YbaR (Trm112 family)
MVAAGAHIADHVLPRVAIRQWVLTVPWELRMLLMRNKQAFSAVMRVFGRAVCEVYTSQARNQGVHNPKTGGIVFPQRFGGSLNAHPHVHDLFADGVFTVQAFDDVKFVQAQPPSREQIAQVAQRTRDGVLRWLSRSGMLTAPRESDEAKPLDACLQAAISRGSFLRLGQQGEPVASINRDDARFNHRDASPWSASLDGFTVHAGVSIGRANAEARERLIRYCARPALSLERLDVLPGGFITYRSKYPLSGGRTHRVMQPMELMARLAALVPPPRFALIRYLGVFSPASPLRGLVVPSEPVERSCAHQRKSATEQAGTNDQHARANSAPVRTDASTEQDPSLAFVPEQLEQAQPPSLRKRKSYIDWATLMQRGLNLDVLACPKCEQRMTVVSAITQADVANKILAHLNIPTHPEQLSDRLPDAVDVTGQSVAQLEQMLAQQCSRGPPEHHAHHA